MALCNPVQNSNSKWSCCMIDNFTYGFLRNFTTPTHTADVVHYARLESKNHPSFCDFVQLTPEQLFEENPISGKSLAYRNTLQFDKAVKKNYQNCHDKNTLIYRYTYRGDRTIHEQLRPLFGGLFFFVKKHFHIDSKTIENSICVNGVLNTNYEQMIIDAVNYFVKTPSHIYSLEIQPPTIVDQFANALFFLMKTIKIDEIVDEPTGTLEDKSPCMCDELYVLEHLLKNEKYRQIDEIYNSAKNLFNECLATLNGRNRCHQFSFVNDFKTLINDFIKNYPNFEDSDEDLEENKIVIYKKDEENLTFLKKISTFKNYTFCLGNVNVEPYIMRGEEKIGFGFVKVKGPKMVTKKSNENFSMICPKNCSNVEREWICVNCWKFIVRGTEFPLVNCECGAFNLVNFEYECFDPKHPRDFKFRPKMNENGEAYFEIADSVQENLPVLTL
uniref:Uncharacterized protein n=1 Tax=Panagrolaimus sp. JU765 TaxID=591449 RepID=A0AC34RPI6_9BILA